MADSSQEQQVGDIESQGAVGIGQAGKNLVQNSPGTTIQNIWSIFGGGKPATEIDWGRVASVLKAQKKEIRQRREDARLDVLADIDLVDRPDGVDRNPLGPIRTLRKLETGGKELIGPERSLVEIFDRDRQLLILGAPGAGKTTALLELAEVLVDRALLEPTTAIPLIFELSNWRDDKQSLRDWLLEQLYEKYRVNPKSGLFEPWLEQRKLLPLLDGLDELGFERQKVCTQRINEFVTPEQSVVVCCRVKEFELADVSLGRLSWAVELQPLSDRQIRDYLGQVGTSGLWEQIQSVPEMRRMLEPIDDLDRPEEHGNPGLLRVPLFVSLAADVYTESEPIKNKYDLFEKYIDRRLAAGKRKGDRRGKQQHWAFKTVEAEPKSRETRRSLIWIASRLKQENQVELLIEKMQPSWLLNHRAKSLYQVITILITALGSTVAGALSEALVGGVVCGIIYGLNGISEIIELRGNFRISISHEIRPELLSNMYLYTLLGSYRGLNGGCIGVLIFMTIVGLSIGPIDALLIIPVGIIGTLFWGLIGGLSGLTAGSILGLIEAWTQELKLVSKPNQGIWNSLQSATLITLFAFLFLNMGIYCIGWIRGTSVLTNFNFLIFPSILLGFIVGGKAVIQHLSLRIILTRHHKIPWNLARFLTYCHERRLLQQIGGRYRFIHRELLEHFANLPE